MQWKKIEHFQHHIIDSSILLKKHTGIFNITLLIHTNRPHPCLEDEEEDGIRTIDRKLSKKLIQMTQLLLGGTQMLFNAINDVVKEVVAISRLNSKASLAYLSNQTKL